MFSRLLRSNLIYKSKINIKIIDKQVFCRYASSSKNDSTDEGIPENFYDEELETEKVYQDLVKSLKSGGLGKLTSINYNQSKELPNDEGPDFTEVLKSFDQDATYNDFDIDKTDVDDEDYDFSLEEESEEESEEDLIAQSLNDPLVSQDYTEMMSKIDTSDPDIMEGTMFIPDRLDFNKNWENEDDENPLLDRFIPSDPSDGNYSGQERSCPGKLQRHGKTSLLRCHLIDLDKLTYIDVVTLRNFMSDDAEILGRKGTGLCAKCQRKVAKTIKTSRNFGLLPHIGEYNLSDSRPLYKKKNFHENGTKVIHRVVSKTIL